MVAQEENVLVAYIFDKALLLVYVHDQAVIIVICAFQGSFIVRNLLIGQVEQNLHWAYLMTCLREFGQSMLVGTNACCWREVTVHACPNIRSSSMDGAVNNEACFIDAEGVPGRSRMQNLAVKIDLD